MKKIIYCLLSFSFLGFSAQSQNEGESINTGVANFLLITPDSRSAGMGGTGVALMGNNNAVFYNGASVLLDEARKGGVTYSFVPWMRDYESGYSLNSVGGFYKINSRNALLGGFRYYNYPKFGLIQEGERIDKEIHPREWAIDLGYAREFLSNFALSATLRYIHSDMGSIGEAKSGSAVAFDIGFLYKKDIRGLQEGNWALGLQIGNVGSKIKYLDKKESLPTIAKLGGQVDLPFSLIHRLVITADLGYRLAPSDVQSLNVNTGVEYIVIERIMLRGGYHYGNKDKGDANYATAGLGTNLYGAHIDFSWLFAEKKSIVRNSFFASVGFSF